MFHMLSRSVNIQNVFTIAQLLSVYQLASYPDTGAARVPQPREESASAEVCDGDVDCTEIDQQDVCLQLDAYSWEG